MFNNSTLASAIEEIRNKRKWARVTPSQDQLIAFLYHETKSCIVVGERLNMSDRTVRSVLIRLGIPRRPYKRHSDATQLKAIALYQEDNSIYEVQRILGLKSAMSVYFWLKQAGIPLRSRGDGVRLRVAKRRKA